MTSFTRAMRRKTARRIAAVGAVTAGALFLTACGDDGDDMSGMDHGSSSSASANAEGGTDSASFNDTDVAFAQMMIPHHEQALEMARMADGRASDTEIKDIAGKIEKAQDPEIKKMNGWLKSWKQPTAMESMAGMEQGGDGMMSDGDMDELKAMKGTEFDKMFAQMMIDHHNGAISTAKDEQKNGKSTEAMKMAGDIVKGQSAEVSQLKSILDRL